MVKNNRWGVCLLLILCCWLHAEQSLAVLKEKDINDTLTILNRQPLTIVLIDEMGWRNLQQHL